MYLSYKNFFYSSLIISTVSVATSFFFEYYYNLTPCKICLIQRYMWILISVSSFIALFRVASKKIISLITLIAYFLLSLIALYHTAIELGFISNIFSCTTTSGLEATSVEQLSDIIMNTENNDCAFPKFSFLGITFSNLSFITSTILLFLNLQVTKKILSNNYEV